jgi:hypothetical protein
MNLEKLVAVSGRPGIYKMAANRPNGLIIEDLDSGKKLFAPSRRHQFTPLESISIYTETEEATVELKTVFINMLTQFESNPPIATKASSTDIKNYFEVILPEYDRDKVLVSDIKKLIKWFNYLNERELLALPTEEELAAEAAAKVAAEAEAKKTATADKTEEE